MSRKQIAFDLDTELLDSYYPSKSWRNAYSDIKRYMEENGFEWNQGSVYISKKSITNREAIEIFQDLLNEYDWLNLANRETTLTTAKDSELDLTKFCNRNIELVYHPWEQEEEIEESEEKIENKGMMM
ncbi:hypothetical protein [Bulleidia sp. zg-1006]|uniref:hypothetical protein n=1 Tax=Bacillati TaxID=1783272 RepID=UPI001939AFF5|nr:hypothetical protein [Bulleidia sp. zg-1006]MBW9213194.1 hypothetical protein [Trueperella sp. zg.1013]QRG86924.1 hypothetical protein JOS54_00995 [Bulleidia sp. zg-1006]